MDSLSPQIPRFLASLPRGHRCMIAGALPSLAWCDRTAAIVISPRCRSTRAALESLFSMQPPANPAYPWRID